MAKWLVAIMILVGWYMLSIAVAISAPSQGGLVEGLIFAGLGTIFWAVAALGFMERK